MDRVFAVILCVVVIVFAVFILVYCGNAMAEPVEIIDTQPTVAETTEETTEVAETEVPTTMATEPPVVLYDVPIDAELQLHIIDEANEHDIDPAIIIAMAFRESSYRTDAIGDGGDSLGLLQIQPKWNKARMDKLGCPDLLDPYQNVVVGVDLLCELLNRYDGNMAKALTSYNQGHYNGTVTQYAKSILAHAEKINNERSQ